jgi:hypothetical protein
LIPMVKDDDLVKRWEPEAARTEMSSRLWRESDICTLRSGESQPYFSLLIACVRSDGARAYE